MKPLLILILVALCGFTVPPLAFLAMNSLDPVDDFDFNKPAMPQTTKAPTVILGGSHNDTQVAPHTKYRAVQEYPTLKACESSGNPEWQFDCYRLKDGKWAIVTDSTKLIPKSKSILEIGTGHPPTPGYIELPLAMALVSEPQMMVPTMRDKVTHTRELGCEKGYELWHLSSDVWGIAWNGTTAVRTEPDTYKVCVKPSFIAQLRKAEQ